MSKKIIIVSGKRKTAIAKAVLREGTGKIKINSITLDLYTPKIYRMKLEEPLILADELRNKIDIDITVTGGGQMGQCEAARMAVAKALVEYNAKLKQVFLEYDRNLLVADVRHKEARKPNTHGHARSKKQKSYR
ncbi:MAG: 30S ribosomal protein S9 [archaeon]